MRYLIEVTTERPFAHQLVESAARTLAEKLDHEGTHAFRVTAFDLPEPIAEWSAP